MKIFIASTLCLVLLLGGCASPDKRRDIDASRPAASKSSKRTEEHYPEEADLKPKTGNQWLPVYTVPLYYPQKALDKGIEGYVLLKYTVTKTGTVRDVVVIDSRPLNYFEWAAISAAAGFRYQPKIVNGVPVDAPGVEYKVDFKLEKLR